MFGKFIAGLLTLLLGGEKAVARALSSFDKVIVDLENAMKKLEQETQASVERQDAAYAKYDAVNEAERAKQYSIAKAGARATSVHQKVTALVQE